jgi:hypothetical protein
MKKILLILGLIITISTPTFAECEVSCIEPYDLSGGMTKFLSTVTGSHFVSKHVAKSIVKKEARKIGNTEFDVNIESFSAADLKAGRFKALKIKGEDVNYQNLYLKSLTAKTMCDFNYIVKDNNTKKITFKEAFPLIFEAKLNSDNINAMLKSMDYQKKIDELNNLQGTFGLVKIKSTNISIQDNRLLYVINLSLPFMKNTQSVILSSDLTVDNGKIALKDTKLINNTVSLDITKLNYILKYLNPFDYSVNISGDVSAQLELQNVKIENNEIVATGIFVIPKDSI